MWCADCNTRTSCTASVSRRKLRLKFTSSIIVAVAKRHREHKCSNFFLAALLLLLPANSRAQTSKVSVLDFGQQPIARRAAELLRERLRTSGAVEVTDADLSRVAAKGIGYAGDRKSTRLNSSHGYI